MPTNKVIADDDPELIELLKGGGVKAETMKERERFLEQFKEFVVKETGGTSLEELVGCKEGLERMDLLFPKYFLTMEVTVTEKGQVVKRRPKLGYANKVRSALKCQILEVYKVDVFDEKTFPNHKKQWMSFQHKLAKEGLAETEHFAEVDPTTMEAIMELVNNVYQALKARGKPDYQSKLQKVPLDIQPKMHVWLQRGAHFIHNLFEVRRGGENSRQLRKSDFAVIEDPVKNFKYVKHVRSEKDKNHKTGTQSSLHGSIPFIDFPLINPGEIFEYYLSLLPGEPTMEKLKEEGAGGFLYPRLRWGGTFNIHNPDEVLYNRNMPGVMQRDWNRFIICFFFFSVGQGNINKMMPELTKQVGKEHATNHCLRFRN